MTAPAGVFRIGGAGAASRLGVVGALYAAHATIALAFAWPLARLLAHPVMSHPRGDRVLFDPRGMYLVETLRFVEAEVRTAADGMSLGLLLTLYLGLFPLGVLLCALAAEGRASWRELALGALRSFGPLSALLGAALLLAALACAVPISVGHLLDGMLRRAFDDRVADLTKAGFHLVALALAAILGVLHDLARAAVVTRELPVLPAVRLALATFAARPLAAAGAWAVRGSCSLLLVVIAARATGHIGIETSMRLTAVTILHQGVAFALVFLRADWLAFAIGLVPRASFGYTTDR